MSKDFFRSEKYRFHIKRMFDLIMTNKHKHSDKCKDFKESRKFVHKYMKTYKYIKTEEEYWNF